MMKSLRDEIIITGPMCSGKTTISSHISGKTGLGVAHMDQLRWEYFYSMGYSDRKADSITEKYGMKGLFGYFKNYELDTLEAILHDYSDCIFDTGGGFFYYEDASSINRINKIVKSFPRIYTLLPSRNVFFSLRILNKRLKERYIEDPDLLKIINKSPDFCLNKTLLNFFINSSIKKIYTLNKSPKIIIEEIF